MVFVRSIEGARTAFFILSVQARKRCRRQKWFVDQVYGNQHMPRYSTLPLNPNVFSQPCLGKNPHNVGQVCS